MFELLDFRIVIGSNGGVEVRKSRGTVFAGI
jgi:hypothetical protein